MRASAKRVIELVHEVAMDYQPDARCGRGRPYRRLSQLAKHHRRQGRSLSTSARPTRTCSTRVIRAHLPGHRDIHRRSPRYRKRSRAGRLFRSRRVRPQLVGTVRAVATAPATRIAISVPGRPRCPLDQSGRAGGDDLLPVRGWLSHNEAEHFQGMGGGGNDVLFHVVLDTAEIVD